MPCDELEEGEIESDSEQQAAQQAAAPIAGPGAAMQQEDEDGKLELRKRKPKKEKKSKSLSWLPPAGTGDRNGASPKAAPAAGYYDVYGKGAHASVQIKADGPVRLNDVQALLLWILADAVSPRWAFVRNKPLIRQVILVMAHGISLDMFEKKQHLLPNMQQLGKSAVVIAPNAHARAGQSIGALLNTSSSQNRKRKQPDASSHAAPPFPPSHYCLTVKEMESFQYPLPIVDQSTGTTSAPQGFVLTLPAAVEQADEPPPPPPPPASDGDPLQDAGPKAKRRKGGKAGAGAKISSVGGAAAVSAAMTVVSGASGAAVIAETATAAVSVSATAHASLSGSAQERMIGLDCEMCITEQGFELTRVTLVDCEGGVLMDELVVPHNPITDYNTRYSGITEEMLSTVTTRLEDIQKRFCKLVTAETLLVGHSLENDLKALRIVHQRCLDTALMYPHPKGPPYRSALKVLAQKFLRRKIQDGSHDSIIDACTAMDLAQLKIKHGPSYGTSEYESGNVRKLVDVLGHDAKRRCCLIDKREALARFATGSAAAIPVNTDAEAAEHVAKEAARGTYAFVATQLLGLYTFQLNKAEHENAEYLATHRKPEGEQAPDTASGPGQAPGSSTQGVGAEAGEGRAAEGGGEGELAGGAPSPSRDFSEEALDRELKRLDGNLGKIMEAMQPNALLVVATGEGDTAQCRRIQELKFKRTSQVDGLPAWSLKEEEAYQDMMDREIQGLCWCYVKPPAQ